MTTSIPRLPAIPFLLRNCCIVTLLATAACGSGPGIASDGSPQSATDQISTTTTETTSTTATSDLRLGAPLRADADPWPENYADIEPGHWYQLDFLYFLVCGPTYFLGLPSEPPDTVFQAKTWHSSDVASNATEDPNGDVSGVGRINVDGDLEFTIDEASDVARFEAVPRSNFTERDLACD